MALWAFVLGYFVSSLIQVFVTKDRMKSAMGGDSAKSVGLGTFFGFISSSCSFSALATTKSLIKKGAGFVPAIAFLLSSTNLVIELGIVIAVFMSWQFVVGEYIGGILLILISWILIKLFKPNKLLKQVRNRLSEEQENHGNHQQGGLFQKWKQVGSTYVMEWQMVWKDVTIGFTVAGIIAAFVPNSFFNALFIGTGSGGEFSLLELVQHVLVAPLAAFVTFIGSMGNIPLAALLFSKGVSFAGIMAFIFSDLVVFPVLRINAKYYGWKMSFFLVGLLFLSLILSSLLLHTGFSLTGFLPTELPDAIQSQEFFSLDYSFWLNLLFLVVTGVLLWFHFKNHQHHHHAMAGKGKVLEKVLSVIAYVSYAWLAVGMVFYAIL